MSSGEIWLLSAMLIGILAVIAVGYYAWLQTRSSSNVEKIGTAKGIISHIQIDRQFSDEQSLQSEIDEKHDSDSSL